MTHLTFLFPGHDAGLSPGPASLPVVPRRAWYRGPSQGVRTRGPRSPADPSPRPRVHVPRRGAFAVRTALRAHSRGRWVRFFSTVYFDTFRLAAVAALRLSSRLRVTSRPARSPQSPRGATPRTLAGPPCRPHPRAPSPAVRAPTWHRVSTSPSSLAGDSESSLTAGTWTREHWPGDGGVLVGSVLLPVRGRTAPHARKRAQATRRLGTARRRHRRCWWPLVTGTCHGCPGTKPPPRPP